MGLQAGAPSRVSKVRKGGGKVGTKSKIDPAIRRQLEAKWNAILTGPTGCATYAELRAQLGLRL